MLHQERYADHKILNTGRGIRVEGLNNIHNRPQFIILLALPVMVAPSASMTDAPAAIWRFGREWLTVTPFLRPG